MSGQGWQPIADLDHDEYVLGYSIYAAATEDCPVNVYFMGRRFHRAGRLMNEWTGKSRPITHWMPLPAAPVIA